MLHVDEVKDRFKTSFGLAAIQQSSRMRVEEWTGHLGLWGLKLRNRVEKVAEALLPVLQNSLLLSQPSLRLFQRFERSSVT